MHCSSLNWHSITAICSPVLPAGMVGVGPGSTGGLYATLVCAVYCALERTMWRCLWAPPLLTDSTDAAFL